MLEKIEKGLSQKEQEELRVKIDPILEKEVEKLSLLKQLKDLGGLTPEEESEMRETRMRAFKTFSNAELYLASWYLVGIASREYYMLHEVLKKRMKSWPENRLISIVDNASPKHYTLKDLAKEVLIELTLSKYTTDEELEAVALNKNRVIAFPAKLALQRRAEIKAKEERRDSEIQRLRALSGLPPL